MKYESVFRYLSKAKIDESIIETENGFSDDFGFNVIIDYCSKIDDELCDFAIDLIKDTNGKTRKDIFLDEPENIYKAKVLPKSEITDFDSKNYLVKLAHPRDIDSIYADLSAICYTYAMIKDVISDERKNDDLSLIYYHDLLFHFDDYLKMKNFSFKDRILLKHSNLTRFTIMAEQVILIDEYENFNYKQIQNLKRQGNYKDISKHLIDNMDNLVKNKTISKIHIDNILSFLYVQEMYKKGQEIKIEDVDFRNVAQKVVSDINKDIFELNKKIIKEACNSELFGNLTDNECKNLIDEYIEQRNKKKDQDKDTNNRE